jgi:acetoin utilization deacetylase AcuC-like enzyme
MLVVFSDVHRHHHPVSFLSRGRLTSNPEVPARVDALLDAARAAGHQLQAADVWDEAALRRVHTADYLDFLDKAWERWTAFTGTQDEIVPQVHPNRHMEGRPSGILGQIGQFIADANCPIHAGTAVAARGAVSASLGATKAVLDGARVAYAACRPPGHHAFSDAASGFCILNNVAVAAEYARAQVARVAIVDIDIHHGNGTQSIFYRRPDVFFVSVHRDPSDFYPFYAGYADEGGAGPGDGFNLNLPLPAGYDDQACHAALAEGLERVREFGADLLFVALGFDAHQSDPHGSGQMTTAGFGKAATRIKQLGLPTVIIQEGGYLSADLGPSLAAFLSEMDF